MKNLTEPEYEIRIDPKILEFLGPKLYTNIYFVLSELIANSYDANAKNVYVIKKTDRYVVEDDGNGMSRTRDDIKRYLDVAEETRSTQDDIYVEGSNKKRKRLGRKGIGKLAALAVSERVLVQTIKDKEASGFILARKINPDRKLVPIKEPDIKFEKSEKPKHGTSIVMLNPEYELTDDAESIKNNLIRLFPVVSKTFKIHIQTPTSKTTLDSFDKQIIKELAALITLGKDYRYLTKNFRPEVPKNHPDAGKLLDKRDAFTSTVSLKAKSGDLKDYKLEIKGWIGAYQSTKNRKKDRGDFEDNFISLCSNGKLGEYDILPTVGSNRIPEVYVVGQLHVDLFEETELPDMALSNRQGYKSDDERYKVVIKHVRERLLRDIVAMRVIWAQIQKEKKNAKRLAREKDLEKKLSDKYKAFQKKTADSVTKKLSGKLFTADEVSKIVNKALNSGSKLLDLKSRVDSQKKRIMICHKSEDSKFSDLIFDMLLFNGVPKDDIIYTSSEFPECCIPEDDGVFTYLRDFFVDSISNEKIFVIYVTSELMARSWNPVTEVGAGWITECGHKIFSLNGYKPEKPLDTDTLWQDSSLEKDGTVSMTKQQFNRFVQKILSICERLKYTSRSKRDNEKKLGKLVKIT